MTLVPLIRLYVPYISSACCQRPYHVKSTGSRPITEVKQRRARLVLGWVTAWEHRVLLASFLELFFWGGGGGGRSPLDLPWMQTAGWWFTTTTTRTKRREKRRRKKHILDASVSFSTGAVSMQPFFSSFFYSFINSGFSVQVQTTVIILLI